MVPAARRDAGVRVAAVTAAVNLRAVKLARMLREVVVGQYSSFEPSIQAWQYRCGLHQLPCAHRQRLPQTI